jgi:hypothetical protein
VDCRVMIDGLTASMASQNRYRPCFPPYKLGVRWKEEVSPTWSVSEGRERDDGERSSMTADCVIDSSGGD